MLLSCGTGTYKTYGLLLRSHCFWLHSAFLSMIAEDGSMMYDFVDAVKALQMVMQQQVNHRALT